MNQALYRKYRSRSFDEVIGQEHVTKTLQRAIKTGRISHAYLFTGPRGVGKTTVARILARQVNSFGYEGEAAHLDIIEIDAASNRRIDEIRDLRDRVRIAPAVGRFKIYIVDEVHMLTKEAFNALLKTLEEPPAHTIFILATTEAHKLPDTIISRTQRFEFKPIAAVQAAKQLGAIAKQEKIDITPGALDLLAAFGDGSFRDSISYLDQLGSAGSKITEEDVRGILGWPSETQIKKILIAVKEGQSKQTLSLLQSLKDSGIDAATVASSISTKLRQDLISGQPAINIELLKQLLEVAGSDRPYDRLELALLEAAVSTAGIVPDRQHIKSHSKSSEPAATTPPKVLSTQLKAVGREDIFIAKWPEIIERARHKAASIYTALKLAQPHCDNGILTLKVEFPLHQKKLVLSKNKALIADLIAEVIGLKVQVECFVDKAAFDKKLILSNEDVSFDSQRVQSISSIFGGAEVLESQGN